MQRRYSFVTLQVCLETVLLRHHWHGAYKIKQMGDPLPLSFSTSFGYTFGNFHLASRFWWFAFIDTCSVLQRNIFLRTAEKGPNATEGDERTLEAELVLQISRCNRRYRASQWGLLQTPPLQAQRLLKSKNISAKGTKRLSESRVCGSQATKREMNCCEQISFNPLP